jgi:hypothetical protein
MRQKSSRLLSGITFILLVSWNDEQKTWKRRTIYGHGRDGALPENALSYTTIFIAPSCVQGSS